MTQWSTLKSKKPLRRNQYDRGRAIFLSFLTAVLTRMLEREREDPLVRLLVSNHERPGWKSMGG